jgi:hypothetical protein
MSRSTVSLYPSSTVIDFPRGKVIIAEKANVYDATRAAWPVSAKYQAKKNAVAVGLVAGISQGVFTVETWHPSSIRGQGGVYGQIT